MENWDKDGNWIGDNLPDSTQDWGVNPDTDTPLEMIGGLVWASGGIVKISLVLGVISFLVWVVFKIAGVL